MNIFWFLVYIAGAFAWFTFAAGYSVPSPWMVTFAFVALGLQSIIWAMKELLKTD